MNEFIGKKKYRGLRIAFVITMAIIITIVMFNLFALFKMAGIAMQKDFQKAISAVTYTEISNEGGMKNENKM